MKIHKGFKYRIYPTPEQEARLLRWESALRWLWNLALEQRKMGLARPNGERIYLSAFDQINQLKELRAEAPWLADVPRDVCAQLLVELDKAWQRCFQREGGAPSWKKRGQAIGMNEVHYRAFRVEGAAIKFPKIGVLRAVVHREPKGTPKICCVRREGDQWFAGILCAISAPNPVPRLSPVVAIDRGITHLLADSDGKLTQNPKHYERAMKRLARAQRRVARRKKGSNRREKAKLRVMRLHRKIRRQREHYLHVLSHRYAKSHGVVVIEKLNVQGMIRGRLSRHIADAGWSKFAGMLHYKLAWSGGTLIEVPAHYSSQTCSECGCIDAASRKGERFCCTGCGHVDHADLNAAKVLQSRANRSALPVEASALAGLRSGKSSRKSLRTPRRRSTEGSAR
jgi:putative transposase